MIPNWLNLLPLKSDIDEAKIQYEILATIIQENPTLVFGDSYQRLEQVVSIFGEIFQKKYLNEQSGVKIASILQ